MLILGVDAGGTSTRAVLVRWGGSRVEVLGRGVAGGGNANSVGAQAAEAALRAAIAGSLGDVCASEVDGAGIGIAGRAGESIAGDLWGELSPSARCWVGHDLPAAFASGTHQLDGAVLVAGTGSMAASVRGGQLTHAAGGWGWFLGDEGSGTWLGREVLRAALADLSGSGPKTALTCAVAIELGTVPSALTKGDITSAVYSGVPSAVTGRFAALATSSAGDPVADQLMSDCAAHLVRLVRAVAGPDDTVVAVGSVATDPEISARLRALLGQPLVFATSGLVGAVVKGVRVAGGHVGRDEHERLMAALGC